MEMGFSEDSVEKWYWVDTNWACGAMIVNNSDMIVYTCPIFRKFIGQDFGNVKKYYKYKLLEGVNNYG